MNSAELQPSLSDIATRIRISAVRATTKAGSGHPTTACSAADLVAALFFTEMRLDLENCENPAVDRFLLSKGHAAPLLYGVWEQLGVVSPSWVDELREITSDFEGHPTPRLPFVDVATGSLGQGLSIGLGMALAMQADAHGARAFVLCGDGEIAEGAVWEAVELAGYRKLGNLCTLIDCNQLGQSGEAMYGADPTPLAAAYAALGWHTLVIDGHDFTQILDAFAAVRKETARPSAIFARTLKGKGLGEAERASGWHGKPLSVAQAAEAVATLESLLTGAPELHPRQAAAVTAPARPSVKLDNIVYAPDAKVATRAAFGDALLALGESEPLIVAIDGDTQNSTYTEKFHRAYPDRYIQAYIAEQNMVGIATGQAVMGRIPFAATFAAFFARAYDQIRMGAISRVGVNLCGSHAGVSIGADGPSQMGLEDLAMMRAVPNCTVLYPSDAVSTQRATELAANHAGMVYIRTTRPATPVLYSSDDEFEIGRCRVLRSSNEDQVSIVAGGITLFEALQAADALLEAGIAVRIVDIFSVKPVDTETLRRCAADTGGKVLTVEDHYPEGGIGDAVAAALAPVGVAVRRLAVQGLPRSGSATDLLEVSGISAHHIEMAVREYLA